MNKWNKANAIKALQELLDHIPNIQAMGRRLQQQMRWPANAVRLLDGIIVAHCSYYTTLSDFSWQPTGQMVFQLCDTNGDLHYRQRQSFFKRMNQPGAFGSYRSFTTFRIGPGS